MIPQNVKLFTISLLFLSIFSGCWISGAVVSGVVVDEAGAPLAGAVVILSGDDTYQAVTDANGAYLIEDIANGQYLVTVTLGGYTFNPDSKPIVVEGENIYMSSIEGNPISTDIIQINPEALDFTGGTYECSIPSYEPDYWNASEVVRRYNNCYNYATNVVNVVPEGGEGGVGIPGVASGYDWSLARNTYLAPCYAYRQGAISDGLEYIGDNGECPDNKAKLALFTRSDSGSWHWYRQDSDGTWSHKFSTNLATNLDDAGNIIYDPRTAARSTWLEYFCGYFCACSSSIQGQGHEIIAGDN